MTSPGSNPDLLPTPSGKTATVPGLDTFRFLAFFLVFSAHTGMLTFGYVGVQAFYVLSGFLLTPILLTMRDSLPTTGQYFSRFYGRRALRILPLYFTYLAGAALLFSLVPIRFFPPAVRAEVLNFPAQLPYALTFTYNFFHASRGFRPNSFVTHFWSLAVEEQFYLVWPVLLVAVPRRHFKALLTVIILTGPIIRGATALIAERHILPFLMGYGELVVYVLPFSHLDAFALGGLAGCCRIPRAKVQLLILAPCALILGYALNYRLYQVFLPNSLGYPPFMNGALRHIWGYSLLNYIFALTLAAISREGLFPAFFNTRGLGYLGRISYGLYVFHVPVIILLQPSLESFPAAARIGVALLVTVVISTVSYELYEKRFLMLKDTFFPKSAEP